MDNSPDGRTVPRLSIVETAAVLLARGGPLFAKGIIVRRPWVVGLLQATVGASSFSTASTISL
jgi:hypothetical protein